MSSIYKIELKCVRILELSIFLEEFVDIETRIYEQNAFNCDIVENVVDDEDEGWMTGSDPRT